MDGTDAAGTGPLRPFAPAPDPARLRLRAGLWRAVGGDGGTAAGVGRAAAVLREFRTGRRSRRRVGSDVAGPVEGELPIVAGDACRLGLADDPVAAEGEGASGGDHAVPVTGFIVKLHSTSQWAQIAAAS